MIVSVAPVTALIFSLFVLAYTIKVDRRGAAIERRQEERERKRAGIG